MPINISRISLVNRALGLLGAPVITSFDNPETPPGKVIVNNYDMVRRDILYIFPWPFAETWACLNVAGTPPLGPVDPNNPTATPSPIGYSTCYALPQDFIRLVDSGDPVSGCGRVGHYRFIQQGGQRVIATDPLTTNSSTAPNQLACAYIADIELLALWPPGPLEAFAYKLAMESAKQVTGEDKLAQILSQQYSLVLKDAVGIEGSSQPKLREEFSKVGRDRDLAFNGYGYFFTPVTGYPST